MGLENQGGSFVGKSAGTFFFATHSEWLYHLSCLMGKKHLLLDVKFPYI
jgi:hypothetical protein